MYEVYNVPTCSIFIELTSGIIYIYIRHENKSVDYFEAYYNMPTTRRRKRYEDKPNKIIQRYSVSKSVGKLMYNLAYYTPPSI